MELYYIFTFMAIHKSALFLCYNLKANHFWVVSTDSVRGSKVSLGSNSSLIHPQKLLIVKLALSLTMLLFHTYIVAFLFNSSFFQTTPLCWYWPCLHSGISPLIVLLDLPIISPASSAALVSPTFRCLTNWKDKNNPKDTIIISIKM